MRRKGLLWALAFAVLFTSVPVNTAAAFSDGSAAFEADGYEESLLPVALSLETGPQNTIFVDGSDIDLQGLRVKVRYEDGSEKSVDCQSNYQEDEFGNYIYVELYGVDENGNLDRENYGSLYEVSPGIYYLDVEIWSEDNIIYLDNPVRIEVKSKTELAVEIPQTGEMTDLEVVDEYAHAKFTPQADGCYILESRTAAEIRVCDALGEDLSSLVSTGFESRIWLTAGQTYLIELYSYHGLGRAGLSITQEPPYEASLSVQQPEIIEGSRRLWFAQAGLVLHLTHKGETVKLAGTNMGRYGYEVRIVNKSTGEVWDEYAFYKDLKPGTYEITAVRKTEGGTILSASLPVEITVKGISYETLPELTENKEMLLPASGERQALRFKPSRSGFYTVAGVSQSEIHPLSNLSETVEDGYLEQGKTYIFWFLPIADRRLIKIFREEEKVLAAGAGERIDAQEGQQKHFLFTPAETGDYVLHLENEEKNVQGKIEIPEINISTDDSTYVGQFTKGKTYRIYTKGVDGCPYVFSIHKPKAIQSAVAVPTSDTLYEEFNRYHSNLFTIRITYTDGTTAEVKEGETNLYGSSFRYASSLSNPDRVTDNQGTVLRSWTINVYDAAQKKYIDTVAQAVYRKDTTGVPELTTGVPLKITYEGQLLIFRFTPETSGKYALHHNIMTVGSWYWQNGVDIDDGYYEAGQPVYIFIWPENVFEGDVCTFTMKPASDLSGKEVTGITLQKAADPVLPIQNDASGMKAEVSYTDGTTAVITSEDTDDGYGNAISTGVHIVAGNKAKVYIICGSYRASCIVDMKDIEKLPKLGIGTETKFSHQADRGYLEAHAVFRPQETGNYGFSVTSSTRYTNITVYDSEMASYQYDPAVLEAGKTYVLRLFVGSFKGSEVSVTAYRADEDIKDDNPPADNPPADNPPADNPPAVKPPVNNNQDNPSQPEAAGTVIAAQEGVFKVTSAQKANPTVALSSPADKNAAAITVPATIRKNGITYQVTAVGKNAFANLKKLKTVKVGAKVTEIGANAFKGCTKLTKVTLPSSMQTIGTGAFSKCTSLKKIVIGKSVKKIGAKAFYGCRNLKTITIRSTKLKSVGKAAMKGIQKKAIIKVPKKKLKAYKKLFKKSTGYKSSMKIK